MFIRYHLIYYGVAAVLFILGLLDHPVFYLVLFVYGIFLVKHLGWIQLLTIIMFLFIFMLSLQWPKTITETVLRGEIINKAEDNFVLKTSQTKVKVYGELKGYEIGDEMEIEVKYFEVMKATNDNAFNYHDYLYSQGITNNGTLTKIISSQKKNTFIQKIQHRINSKELVDSYARMFILGIKDDTISDYYSQLTELSIVHLFALSGLHIHMLEKLLKKILQFIVAKEYLDYLCLGIIGIYIYIIPFNISFTRAYLVMLLYSLSKRFFNRLDCLSIVAIIMIVLNPYVIYNLSFIFSYFMYLIILLINKHKYLNLLVYLASLPIIISIQYRINLLSLFLGVVLTPLITLLYQALWIYLICGDFFKPIIDLLINSLDKIVVFSTDFSFFINFSKPSLFFILCYYFIYFKMLLKINVKQQIKREGLMLLSLMIVFYLSPYYQIKGQVVMIDVGQGDCFFIQQPFNQGNILIDTGGLKNKDLATLTLIPYLRSQGIFKLDYVFISHDDYDHSGAYDSLAEQMEIKHTITTYQPSLKIGQIQIEMLKTIASTDSNDSSLVLLATINNLKYLFTGDISSKVEQQLINDYPELRVDVLKVSHHGSNTASSAAFLNAFKPKLAFISCGKNNRYGHPHKDVLTRLDDYGIRVYRTDLTGMVKIVYYQDDNYIFQ